jgi:hypothetical protein
MTQSSTVVVPLSLLRLLVILLVCAPIMVGSVFLIFGPGSILDAGAAVISGLNILCFVVAAVRQRPRVVITPDGFVVHKLFGEESHLWENIEGPFAVIKIGVAKAVGFKLSASYKARIGKKPTSSFSGYDAAIGGAFKLSAKELAELLNAHWRQDLHSIAPETRTAAKPNEQ